MRLRIQWLVFLMALTLAFTSVGCAMQRKPESQPREQQQGVRDDIDRQPVRYNRTRAGQTMEAADNVADSIAKLKEIDSATVMVTDNTAYVGVVFEKNYQGGLTTHVKNKVAKRAKRVDDSLKRVYVSANPGFVDSLNDYARKAREGRPLGGLVDEFMDLVQRTFPQGR
ncbi:YhcN/YlaJ family sporulation lipoprotein [Salinithrix halophila]|uniref:YhcN/YlaJ family sporulation lipoprotein n=1 Tax=Salinithrix halophila TaxID=1485204 RepID=A0ABV8JHI0_9BACL